jgi:hypothetical protein
MEDVREAELSAVLPSVSDAEKAVYMGLSAEQWGTIKTALAAKPSPRNFRRTCSRLRPWVIRTRKDRMTPRPSSKSTPKSSPNSPARGPNNDRVHRTHAPHRGAPVRGPGDLSRESVTIPSGTAAFAANSVLGYRISATSATGVATTAGNGDFVAEPSITPTRPPRLASIPSSP